MLETLIDRVQRDYDAVLKDDIVSYPGLDGRRANELGHAPHAEDGRALWTIGPKKDAPYDLIMWYPMLISDCTMKNCRKPTLATQAASGVSDWSLMGKDAGIGMPRQSEDLPAPAYIPPPRSESQMHPGEGQRSRSSSKANGTSPYATPWHVRTNSTTTTLLDFKNFGLCPGPQIVCVIC